MNLELQAEQAQVKERVTREATGDSHEARHFWSNRLRGRILTCILNRTWRAAFLLEGCRKTLWHIHRVYFPPNGQPHGLAALLERFRGGAALKEVVNAQLVAGANVALAYVRLHRSNLPLERLLGGLPGDDDYADTLAAARQMIEQVQKLSERLVGPLDAPKDEPVD